MHLLLRSWLLKVDSKHWLCWLSACLYIRTQIVGRLTACCCQSNKSYPPWLHLPGNTVELWTVMSFIWAVCHRHFLSQVCVALPLSLHSTRILPYQKEILSWNPLLSCITYYATAFVIFYGVFSLAYSQYRHPFHRNLTSAFSQAYIMVCFLKLTLEWTLWCKVTPCGLPQNNTCSV